MRLSASSNVSSCSFAGHSLLFCLNIPRQLHAGNAGGVGLFIDGIVQRRIHFVIRQCRFDIAGRFVGYAERLVNSPKDFPAICGFRVIQRLLQHFDAFFQLTFPQQNGGNTIAAAGYKFRVFEFLPESSASDGSRTTPNLICLCGPV